MPNQIRNCKFPNPTLRPIKSWTAVTPFVAIHNFSDSRHLIRHFRWGFEQCLLIKFGHSWSISEMLSDAVHYLWIWSRFEPYMSVLLELSFPPVVFYTENYHLQIVDLSIHTFATTVLHCFICAGWVAPQNSFGIRPFASLIKVVHSSFFQVSLPIWQDPSNPLFFLIQSSTIFVRGDCFHPQRYPPGSSLTIASCRS